MAAALLPGHETVLEYGRKYGVFRRGQYMLPHDDVEKDRMDVMHQMLKVVRGKGTEGDHLLLCPHDGLGRKPAGPLAERPRVLDLGCGTGIWLIDLSHYFPDAELVGVDIHHLGPDTLPENVSLRAPWDYEGPWALGEGSWDIIHLQMALGSVSDWRGLYRKILRHLIPGRGWFEHVELDFQPRCDDGTLRQGKLTDWWELYVKGAYEAVNRRLHYDPGTGDLLNSLGFKDIRHVVYRIPLNQWSNDEVEQDAAQWWRIAMSPHVDASGGFGLEALSVAPLCKFSNWPPEHVKRLCNEALAQATDPNVHVYNELHVWCARAPPTRT